MVAIFILRRGKAMSEDTDDSNRRVVRRRVLGSGRSSSGSGTQSYSGRSSGEDNDDIDLLNSRVESLTSRHVSSSPLSETEEVGRFTPRSRMSDVRGKSADYEREYRLRLVHRMIMRNVPLDQIATELDVSVKTIQRDRQELFRRLKVEAQKLNIDKLIGDSLGFYAEVQGMGLRVASSPKTPTNLRLAAMRTSLGARNDMNRFLALSGVFDVLRFRSAETSAATDIDKLMELTSSILGGSFDEIGGVEMQSIANMDDDEDMVLI